MLRLTAPRSDWLRAEGTVSGPVVAVPARRGVVGHVDVEVRSAAPFGLVWCRRRLRVPLARPLEVGPAPLDVAPPPLVGDETESTAGATRTSTLAPVLPRGLRDYVAGDPPRLVSWVATARHGRLMVREVEAEAASRRLTLVVDLRGPDALAELVASRAAGIAAAALLTGSEVVLSTAEAGALCSDR